MMWRWILPLMLAPVFAWAIGEGPNEVSWPDTSGTTTTEASAVGEDGRLILLPNPTDGGSASGISIGKGATDGEIITAACKRGATSQIGPRSHFCVAYAQNSRSMSGTPIVQDAAASFAGWEVNQDTGTGSNSERRIQYKFNVRVPRYTVTASTSGGDLANYVGQYFRILEATGPTERARAFGVSFGGGTLVYRLSRWDPADLPVNGDDIDDNIDGGGVTDSGDMTATPTFVQHDQFDPYNHSVNYGSGLANFQWDSDDNGTVEFFITSGKIAFGGANTANVELIRFNAAASIQSDSFTRYTVGDAAASPERYNSGSGTDHCYWDDSQDVKRCKPDSSNVPSDGEGIGLGILTHRYTPNVSTGVVAACYFSALSESQTPLQSCGSISNWWIKSFVPGGHIYRLLGIGVEVANTMGSTQECQVDLHHGDGNDTTIDGTFTHVVNANGATKVIGDSGITWFTNPTSLSGNAWIIAEINTAPSGDCTGNFQSPFTLYYTLEAL